MPQHRIRVVDSHTAGEPTRVVIDGSPELPAISAAERAALLRHEHDAFRSAVVCEPRGSDALVGAWLGPALDPSCLAAVIYFNNVGYLGMCIHGTIGLMATLAHLGRIEPGRHRLETPAGLVEAELLESGDVAVTNVASYRHAADVAIDVPGFGTVVGDIAFAGNWFFLVQDHGQQLTREHTESLVQYTRAIRQAIIRNNVTGAAGGEIDHIALFTDESDGDADSRDFVLCPGGAFDRSPCGTGTSAKLACLHAQGRLKPGQSWRQRGFVGEVFEGSVAVRDGQVFPTVRGRAHVTAEATLILSDRDPFRSGIPQ
ncbi:MAG: hydroxyproline-2-epimerase [Myxococcales bacterium FL481]|nr:MAG: hydroxyproline-2-epimerase [Myxococcales bacterium FL481]